MGTTLFHRISSFFQAQSPTSSHLNLLNESSPLQNLRTTCPVQLIAARPVNGICIEEAFQERLLQLGGKENVLLVGEAGYDTDKYGGGMDILHELSVALFQSPLKGPTVEHTDEKQNLDELETSASRCKSHAPSRMLEFRFILLIFQASFILDPVNKILITEILKDVKVRIKKSRSALVGIVCSQQEPKEESLQKFQLLIKKIFKGHPWSICFYCQSQPCSILEVKRTITETLEDNRTENYQGEDNATNIENSFKDLVCRLGGKEQFLLVGNICPSARPPEHPSDFMEVTKALFGEHNETGCGKGDQGGTSNGHEKSCTQLPKPKPFSQPLILVAFRCTFLSEETNQVKVKEILHDVMIRSKKFCSQVIGIVHSLEELEPMEMAKCQSLLDSMLRQTFSGPVGVCSFVRSRPETVEGIKRCVCDLQGRRR